MRTTVDFPLALHRRVVELAKARGQSLSAIVAELVERGLRQGELPKIYIDERSGFPVLRVGRRVTAEGIAAARRLLTTAQEVAGTRERSRATTASASWIGSIGWGTAASARDHVASHASWGRPVSTTIGGHW